MLLVQHMDDRRRCLYAVELHACFELDKLFLGDVGAHSDAVEFVDAVARMHHLVGKGAVVGEHQHALAVLVESADGIHTLADVLHQLRHAPSAALIVHGRDEAARLVEHDIAEFGFGHDDALAADIYLVTGVYLVAQNSGLAVDFDLPLHDQLLRLSTGGNAALCEKFLQSDRFVLNHM